MSKKKCTWSEKCRNGGDGCWCMEPENCVRFMPTEGTNLTKINGTVETPPGIDADQFSQYFVNWIDAMGWGFTGSFGPYEEKVQGNEEND